MLTATRHTLTACAYVYSSRWWRLVSPSTTGSELNAPSTSGCTTRFAWRSSMPPWRLVVVNNERAPDSAAEYFFRTAPRGALPEPPPEPDSLLVELLDCP